MTKGIDVSKWQGNIDWKKVKKDDVDFAFIRIGYCDWVGNLVIDPTFLANMKGAQEAGVKIGVFMYSYAKTATAAAQAATNVLAKLEIYQDVITFPVAFDIEDEVNKQLSREENTAICKAFLSRIESAGYHPLLYAYKAFTVEHLNMADLAMYDFWLAHVGNMGATKETTDYTGPFTMWQYSWVGRVNGIEGDVDLDYCYKDYGAAQEEEPRDTIILPEPEEPDVGEWPEEMLFDQYVVVKNDNLSKIAANFKVPLKEIIQSNYTITSAITGKTRRLDNPNLIYPGEIVIIPRKPNK